MGVFVEEDERAISGGSADNNVVITSVGVFIGGRKISSTRGVPKTVPMQVPIAPMIKAIPFSMPGIVSQYDLPSFILCLTALMRFCGRVGGCSCTDLLSELSNLYLLSEVTGRAASGLLKPQCQHLDRRGEL